MAIPELFALKSILCASALPCIAEKCRKPVSSCFLSAGGPGKRLKQGKKRIPGPLDSFSFKTPRCSCKRHQQDDWIRHPSRWSLNNWTPSVDKSAFVGACVTQYVMSMDPGRISPTHTSGKRHRDLSSSWGPRIHHELALALTVPQLEVSKNTNLNSHPWIKTKNPLWESWSPGDLFQVACCWRQK